MQAFRAIRTTPSQTYPLTAFVDECYGTIARLTAYVGALAVIGMVGLHLWDQFSLGSDIDPAVGASIRSEWIAAGRSHRAFAISTFDIPGKTETYQTLRHPEGGRKDVFRWAAPGETPVAELEIYRPGAEFAHRGPAFAEVASRMEPRDIREAEAAGTIDTKFGAVTTLRLRGVPDQASSCLGFIKRLEEPALRISGWSCQGDSFPARRAAIGCMLNRLVLLTAGNDPKLADVFARAELRRTYCIAATAATSPTELATPAQNAGLRGATLTTGRPRCWFSCNFLDARRIIVMRCGPIDLVTTQAPQLI